MASNFDEVGHIRRRRGISIKRMMGEHALYPVSMSPSQQAKDASSRSFHLQAYDGEDENEWLGEINDIGNSQCKAEDHRQDASPGEV
jgi:hypothetical protein